MFSLGSRLKKQGLGKNHVTMKKVVEHFQSNRSVCRFAGRTVPLMEVVPPPKKLIPAWFTSTSCWLVKLSSLKVSLFQCRIVIFSWPKKKLVRIQCYILFTRWPKLNIKNDDTNVPIFHVWGSNLLNFDLTEKIFTWKLVRRTWLSLLADQNQSAHVRAHWAQRFLFLLFFS